MSVERVTKVPAPPTCNCDECQPLLVAPRSDQDTSTDPEEQRKPERADELGWKSYTFYGISFAIGLSGLTLIIKGLIDAGDVEVRTLQLSKQIFDFPFCSFFFFLPYGLV